MLADPNGLDTLDLYRNKKGIWEIRNYQRVEGDDVIRLRGEGVQPNDYIFSEGEYGNRVIALNLEGNENYTLGVFLVSGASKEYDEGAYGFYVLPSGNASNINGSHKRIEDGVYTLVSTPTEKFWWVQPKVEGNGVDNRGIKVHPILGSRPNDWYAPTAGKHPWTLGCFVVAPEYQIKNNNIYIQPKASQKTSMYFNLQLGATQLYKHIGTKNRPGATFANGLKKTFIVRTANAYMFN